MFWYLAFHTISEGRCGWVCGCGCTTVAEDVGCQCECGCSCVIVRTLVWHYNIKVLSVFQICLHFKVKQLACVHCQLSMSTLHNHIKKQLHSNKSSHLQMLAFFSWWSRSHTWLLKSLQAWLSFLPSVPELAGNWNHRTYLCVWKNTSSYSFLKEKWTYT